MDLIKYLADKVIERNNKLLEDNAILNMLIKEKTEINKSIDNLLECLQNGMNSNSIKNRLENLELQLNVVEENIAKEKSAKKLQITKQDIIKFIKSGLTKNPQQLIKHFIDKIILFKDKIEIYYKYIEDKKSPDNSCPDFSFCKEELKINLNPYRLKQENLEFIINIETFI